MLCTLPDVLAAIKRDELVPFFQPVVDLRTGTLKGLEVLARWHHPLHGPILPTNFVSLAEDNGLIDELSRQICRKAFSSAKPLPHELTLAVNISPIQMRNRELPTQIRRNAEEAGFSLSRLIIEITESALHHDLERAQQVAASLKDMGCKLALDDFGTGYSNLRHLNSLNFDQLKIDRSFVSGIAAQRDCRKIVAAIIGLGQSLHLEMIAEGVETEEQTAMLIWLGCEFAQGWRYGRAEAANEIPRMVAAEPIPMLPGLTAPGDDWATSSLEALPTLRLAQLQAIYDGAPVGLCFLDQKFRYISLNQRLAEMNGHSVKSHIGKTVEEMYPEWFAIYKPYLLRAREGEAISGITFHRPGVAPGDIGMELLASYQPAWDEADEVVGISISLLDVTPHKISIESTFLASGAQPNEIRVNPELPWVMDAEGNNLQVSSRWVQTIPLGKDRTRNLHWLEALHVDDLEHTIRAMKHALRTGEAIDVEYRVMSIDGEWRWMRSRGSPRLGASGEITRWYGSVEDIHDQKMQELKSSHGEQTDSRINQDMLAKGLIVSDALQNSIAHSGRGEQAH